MPLPKFFFDAGEFSPHNLQAGFTCVRASQKCCGKKENATLPNKNPILTRHNLTQPNLTRPYLNWPYLTWHNLTFLFYLILCKNFLQVQFDNAANLKKSFLQQVSMVWDSILQHSYLVVSKSTLLRSHFVNFKLGVAILI